MRNGTARLLTLVGLLTLLAASVLFRAPQLLNANATQADAALVALQARHWLSKGEWSWFLWGISYQSTLDVALVALAFRTLGDTPTVLMLVPLTGHLIVIALTWDILRRRVGAGKAFLASLILVLAPQPINIVALYVPRQGAITFLFLALWMLDRAQAARKPGFLLAGGVAITIVCLYLDLFTILFLPGWLLFAIACAVDVEPRSTNAIARKLRAILVGGAIGASVVWLASQDPRASTRQAGVSFSRLPENAQKLVRECLPWTLSSRIYSSNDWRYFKPVDLGAPFRVLQTLGAMILVCGIAFGAVAVFAKRLPWNVRRLGALGFVVSLTAIVGFLGSTLPTDVTTARYLAPIVWTAPFALAPAAYRLRIRTFGLLLIPYLVSSTTAGWLAQGAFVRGVRPVVSARGSLRDETQLIEALEELGVRSAKADYWIAYRLDYLFHERIIFTPTSAIEARYPPFARDFDVEPYVAYVFHPSEPREKAETYEQSFRIARVPFERRDVAGFIVLVLNTASFFYADSDGEGILTIVDDGPADDPGYRRLSARLRRGTVEYRGNGRRDAIAREAPWKAPIQLALTGPGGTIMLEGVLTSEFLLVGSGTFVGTGVSNPKVWKIRLRDRADDSNSTLPAQPPRARLSR